MALGAVTKPSPNPDFTIGNKRVKIRDVVPTSGANYTTKGETLAASQVGLHRIDFVLGLVAKNSDGTSSLPLVYDYTNSKLQVYRYDGASVGKASLEEAAANFDASGFTARLVFIGQ